MSSPFLGEIRMIAFNYPTKGFAFANGQQLGVQQNQALFSLLGTTYGGNGSTNFNLPNLQGRSALHFGTSTAGVGYTLGQVAGEAAHTLAVNEMPAHNHAVNVSTTGNLHPAAGNLPGNNSQSLYNAGGSGINTSMANTAISYNGSNQPHENRMPYLVVNFIIALVGIFPSRN